MKIEPRNNIAIANQCCVRNSMFSVCSQCLQ